VNDEFKEKTIRKLIIENMFLLERIDKAIKYLENNINSNSVSKLTSGKVTDIGYCIPAFEDLLDILKGSDSNV